MEDICVLVCPAPEDNEHIHQEKSRVKTALPGNKFHTGMSSKGELKARGPTFLKGFQHLARYLHCYIMHSGK